MSVENSNGLPDIALEIIDRTSVRALVELESKHLYDVAVAEGNVHQASLDRQDQVQAYTASLNEADRQKFTTMYEQEVSASTQTARDAIAAIHAKASAQAVQNLTNASQVGRWVSIVLFFIVLITSISIFKH